MKDTKNKYMHVTKFHTNLHIYAMLLSISLFFLQIPLLLFKRHANQIMKPLCFPTAIAEIFSIFHYRQSSTVIAHFKRNNMYKS